jgi:2-oxo-3-hexenedioate decarboxylase
MDYHIDHGQLAQSLYEAKALARPVGKITEANAGFSLSDAYEVQRNLLARHLAAKETLVGRKMGLTSKPKMQQMGVHEPIHGFLTSAMRINDGGEILLKGRIHPKAEPEIAFVLKRELRGQPSLAEAMAAVEGVCAALEVIDSRFKNFEFALPDVVADNGSSSGFVLGGVMRKPTSLDLGNLGILLELDGKPQQFGSTAAILGHPGRSLAALVALLEAEGKSLPAGSIVLAGAATAAIPLSKGSWVRATFQGLGTVEARAE